MDLATKTRVIPAHIIWSTDTVKKLTLIAGPYLIVATDNSLVGSIDGHAVYSITNFDVIPFSKSTIHLSDAQVNSGVSL